MLPTPLRLVVELGQLGLHRHALLGGQQVQLALVLEPLQLVQPRDPQLHGVEVGQQAAQPALVHVGHPGGLGGLLDDVLGLLLGADEQHDAAARRQVLHERPRPLQQVDGLAAGR